MGTESREAKKHEIFTLYYFTVAVPEGKGAMPSHPPPGPAKKLSHKKDGRLRPHLSLHTMPLDPLLPFTAPSPFQSNFLHFNTVFRKFWSNLTLLPSGFGAPPGNPGSTPVL